MQDEEVTKDMMMTEGAAAKEETAAATNNGTVVDDEGSRNNRNKKEPPKMVSVGQLFTFARTRRTRSFIAAAFCCAIVSGAVFPGKSLTSVLL